MAELFRNNPIASRRAILFEFSKGNPAFEAYQEFCRAFGDDFMIYPDFEFWFIRFSRGEFDLDYDRSLDPKCRTFTELPEHVFNDIGGFLNSDDRFFLRNVSKNIKVIVDSWKPLPNITNMHFHQYMANKERRKYMCLLRNPKLELNTLDISFNDDRSAEIVASLLKQMKHQVRVANFVMKQNLSDITAVISKLDPKTIKTVEIPNNEESFYYMKRFLRMEQIKGLDSLVISTDLEPSEFPLKCFFNHPVFHIKFNRDDDFKPIVQFVEKLTEKDTNLKRCRLTFSYLCHAGSFFRETFSSLGTPVSTQRNTREISILGTDDVYKIKFSNHSVTIVRKGKEDKGKDSDLFSDTDSDSDYDLDDESESENDFDHDYYDIPHYNLNHDYYDDYM